MEKTVLVSKKELEGKVLSLLTDQNAGFVDLQNDDERFGALLAYGKAFKEVSKVFDGYSI